MYTAQELEALIAKGLSTYQIAETLKCSQTNIRYWLKRYNLTTLKPSRKKEKFCNYCGLKLEDNRNKYCDNKCQHKKQQKDYIVKWLKGELSGIIGKKTSRVSSYIRSYLIAKSKGACNICGLDTWMGQPMVLILDHINGDSTDNSPKNLRVICSNCDSLLPTYKSKNKGNGRHYRKERYINNQSY